MQGQHLPHQHGNRTPQHGPPHVLSHFAVRSCLSPPPFAPGAPLATSHVCLRLLRACGLSAPERAGAILFAAMRASDRWTAGLGFAGGTTAYC